MPWINALVQGLLLGGLYALLASGLSLMFGVMRIVNLAHGVLAVASAYVGLLLIQGHVPLLLAVPIVVAVAAGIGFLLHYAILNRAIARGGLAPLLVTFGLAVVLTQVLQGLFTADNRTIQTGSFGTGSLQIGDALAIGWFPLVTFVVAVLVIAAVELFLQHAPLGRAMRATSDDVEAVQLMGIPSRQVYALSTALAMATVGLAGMFLGMRTQFSPTFGDVILIFAFEAVIIGGLGSLWGTLLGGIVLGVAQAIGSQVNPAWGVLVGHLVFLAVLTVKPSGLMPKSVGL
jgi:branched-chain amino acid transport system permease protein